MGSKVDLFRELFRDVFQITTFYIGALRFERTHIQDSVVSAKTLQLLKEANQKLEEANQKSEEANRKSEEANRKLENILAVGKSYVVPYRFPFRRDYPPPPKMKASKHSMDEVCKQLLKASSLMCAGMFVCLYLVVISFCY